MSPRVRRSALLIFSLMVIGTIGFRLIEGWSVLDSLYMTVITLSTVGYGELRPLSDLGRLFTSGLILIGVGSLAFAATTVLEELLDRDRVRRHRLRKELKRMKQHVIICGYGRMGQTVYAQLQPRGRPIVVIERSPEGQQLLEREHIPHVFGDATDDDALHEAGIERADALAAVLPRDSDNLMLTLTARGLNPGLNIVARASKRKNEPRILAAGADRVLNPYRTGGQTMARQLLHPAVTEFMQVLSEVADATIDLEEVRIVPGSSLAGVRLKDSPIRAELDVIVLSVRRHDESVVFNPSSEIAPEAGDTLILLGRRENLMKLEQLAGSGG